MDTDILRLLGSHGGLEVGARVRLRGNKKVTGTIRHAGAVHFATGDHIGVELGAWLAV